jgi:hypothetical protein
MEELIQKLSLVILNLKHKVEVEVTPMKFIYSLSLADIFMLTLVAIGWFLDILIRFLKWFGNHFGHFMIWVYHWLYG